MNIKVIKSDDQLRPTHWRINGSIYTRDGIDGYPDIYKSAYAHVAKTFDKLF